jgi:hypothetical protein
VAGFAAAPGRPGGGVRKKKRKGRGETDDWGPGVSESKKKKKREDVGRSREKDGGLLGCLGRKVSR